MFRKICLYVMATLYFFAGVNHFIKPEMYKKMIPPFIPFHSLVNYATGFIEIGLAILLVIPRTRSFAGKAIIAMLIAFIPVHIYMIYTGWCPGGKCVPAWGLWVRLLILQPVLIWLAWWVTQASNVPESQNRLRV